MLILLSSNKEIIKKYLKQNSKIGFIPTASELDNDRWYMEKDKNDLINMNYELIDIDISNETTEKIIEKLSLIDAVFVAGGNAFYLLQQLKIKDVLSSLIDFANKKIYIGSSAGSCIACPSIKYLDRLDDANVAHQLDNNNAMNLIDSYILPHYKCDDEYSKLIDETVEKNKNLDFIVLTNDQAVIVEDQRNYKIVYTK